MARPLQAAIDTISITGADEAVSIRKLEEHAGDLNQAVNAHFSEGDTTASTINQSIASVNHDDMELDGTLDNTFQRSLFPEAPRDPFALMDPNFQQILFDRVGSASTPNRDAQGSHPREAPIEVKDSNIQICPSGQASVVENVSGHGSLHDPEFRETIIIDDDDEELSSGLSYIRIGPSGQASVVENVSEHGSLHDPEFRETIIIDDDDEELSSGLSYIRIGPGQASVVENVSEHGSLHDPEFRETIIIDDDDEELSSGLSYIQIGPSGQASVVKNVSGHGSLHDPEFRETIIIDHDDEELSSGLSSQHANIRSNESQPNPLPTAPPLVHVTDNDIEEEVIRAAIEASKRESEKLANTAEQERTQHLDGINLGDHFSDEDMETAGGTVRRQELVTGKAGTSTQPADDESSQEETDDVEDQPLVRRRSRRIPSGDTESAQPVLPGDSPPSSSQPQNHDHQYDRTDFPSEWGGISSEEHDEAVMLEVALFGGIPEAPTYPFSIPSHGSSSYYPQVVHSPPLKLTEQRLLREQQDDEYLASLQADQEKEMKTLQEAELRQLEEAAAREAALEKRKQEEEKRRKKQLEKEELESNLATKQASLPLEPPSDKEGVIILVVHMPDGSRQGRRFLKSDKLQSLFDFLDVGRTCRPGTYRLVRSYPRRAFTTGDGDQSFSDLGLTSKQEALFIEQITD